MEHGKEAPHAVNLPDARVSILLGILSIVVVLSQGSLLAQRVELDCPVCYYDVNQMHEYFRSLEGVSIPNPHYLRLFKQIEEKYQNDPSIKAQIRLALLNQFYTEYLQLAYTIEGGVTNPFKGGNYAQCPLGCFPQFLYRGTVYTNICIKRICTEGRIVGTPRYCDPTVGPDIYIHYLTFWCQDVPQATMLCGPSAHCEQSSDGTFLCEYNKVRRSSGDESSGVEYVLIAPADASEPIRVAAFRDGQLIASKPVDAEGPVDASQAYLFAQITGLTQIVALMVGQQGASSMNQCSTCTGGTRGELIVDPR